MTRKPSLQTLTLVSVLVEGSDEWEYGYELAQRTGLSSGTLYPILIRLSDRGHLETRWAERAQPGRPPRHMYRLTSPGRAWALESLRTAATQPGYRVVADPT